MIEYLVQDSTLIDIADAIRSKTKKNTPIRLTDFSSEIQSIGNTGVELNVKLGDTPPTNTNNIWIKTSSDKQLIFNQTTVTTRLTIPYGYAGGVSVAAVGDVIYTFGGMYNGLNIYNYIHKIDTMNLTVSFVGYLPKSICCSSAVTVGTKIYLFGGMIGNSTCTNAIYVFDTETNTTRTVEAVLPNKVRNLSAVAVDSKIYILGGTPYISGYYSDAMYIFDTETDELDIIEQALPYSIKEPAVVAINSDIYILGGNTASGNLDTIVVFDTKTNSAHVLDKTLCTKCSKIVATHIGSKIYVLGNTSERTILTFDIVTGTSIKVGELPYACNNVLPAAVVVGTKIYVMGIGGTNYCNGIYQFETDSTKNPHTPKFIDSLVTKECVQYRSNSVLIGSKIYIVDRASIRVYDTENETFEANDIKLPNTLACRGVAAVGTKIYLFGGIDPDELLSYEISVFDTEDRTVSRLNTPLPHPYHSMITCVVGNKIYLIGGYMNKLSSDYSELNCQEVNVFDCDTEVITTLDSKLSPWRTDVAAVSIGTKIYLFGGSGKNTNCIDIYDTVNDRFYRSSAVFPSEQSNMAAAVAGDKVYLFGGNGYYTEAPKNSIIIYDVNTDVLEVSSSIMPFYLTKIVAHAVGDRIYLLGGIGGTASRSSDSDTYSMMVYDVSDGSFRILSKPGMKQFPGPSAAVGDKIYIFGERDTNAHVPSKNIKMFDTNTNLITTLDASLQNGVIDAAVAVVGTKIYLFGGSTGAFSSNGLCDSIQVFDTQTNTVALSNTTLPKPFHKQSAAVIGTKIYLLGGEYKASGYAGYTSAIYVFDTETEIINSVNANCGACYCVSTAVFGTKIYIFGGCESITNRVSHRYIHVFDTETETTTRLDTRLPLAVYHPSVVALGSTIHIITSSGTMMFDAVSEAASPFYETMPDAFINAGPTHIIGDDMYMLGGRYGGSDEYPSICIFRPASICNITDRIMRGDRVRITGTMDTSSPFVRLVSTNSTTINIRVYDVHVANADGYIIYCPIYKYSNGSWVPIYY